MNAALVLASGSPRRRELLASAGVPFTIDVSNCDESQRPGESVADLVRRLAHQKAAAVAARHPGAWVLGADTDVALDGEILGKPRDAADAAAMLARLAGRSHEVHGGFALVGGGTGAPIIEHHLTLVTFAPMTREFIECYVASGEPLDKAGAYAAQGMGMSFIERVQGSYTNVIGLNLAAVLAALRRAGIVT